MTIPAPLPLPPRDGQHRASAPHAAGFRDALGERQLMLDAATAASVEVLRFKPEFGESTAFEAALRARVEALSGVQHPSLAVVRGVDRRDGEGLCLISKTTSGRRVSELAAKARGPAFALELIREITPAIAALQRAHQRLAHGLISAERIVVTREGRLVLVEHVIGSAIEAMQLSREQLAALGCIVPVGADPVRFDARTDLIQLGCTALSLLIGRTIDPSEYPLAVPALLDEFILAADAPGLAAKLRVWLERAMQISPRSFASAADAEAGLGDLPDVIETLGPDASRSPRPAPRPAMPAPTASAPPEAPKPALLEPAPKPAPAKPDPSDRAATPVPSPAPIEPALPTVESRPSRPTVIAEPTLGIEMAEFPVERGNRWKMIAAGLGGLALVQAAVIVVLLFSRPTGAVIEVQPPPAPAATLGSVVPPASTVLPEAGAVDPVPPMVDAATPAPTQPAPTVQAPPPAAPAPGSTPAPASAPRVGAVKVTSPMDLQVFKDGVLIGSTAGPIALTEGAQQIELVNETLGFHLQQTLTVKAGQVTAVNVAAPNGRISINAVPWADVTIDGQAVGQTPLANLSLPIGSHEIVFRHPDLGERKQTVVVKAEGITKVTQTFSEAQRGGGGGQ